MRKIVVTFGLIAGAILATMMAIMIPLSGHGTSDMMAGYAVMVLAFVMVVLGIRSYREQQPGRAITFGKGFQVGILITLIASAIYVLSWEIIYFNFLPDFMDKYAAHALDELRASGAGEEEIAKQTAEMEHMKVLYANPFINIGMTFLEIFPVGLVVTLLSAAFLRRKAVAGSSPAQRASV